MIKKFLCALLMITCYWLNAHGADINMGKMLFTSRCSSCHAVDRQVIGPALKNIDKIRTESWIISFVHSSQTVIQSGDTAAVKLFKQYNQTIMPDHPDLNEDKIRDIIGYIKDLSGKPGSQPVVKEAPDLRPVYSEGSDGIFHQIIYLNISGEHYPIGFEETGKWLMIFGVIFALIFLLLLCVYYQTFSALISKEINKLKNKGL
jgi:cytochrome c2